MNAIDSRDGLRAFVMTARESIRVSDDTVYTAPLVQGVQRDAATGIACPHETHELSGSLPVARVAGLSWWRRLALWLTSPTRPIYTHKDGECIPPPIGWPCAICDARGYEPLRPMRRYVLPGGLVEVTEYSRPAPTSLPGPPERISR